MSRGIYPNHPVFTTLFCLAVCLLFSRDCRSITVNDDSAEFLQEYFSNPDKMPSEECVRRMRSCLPWEKECCEGLECTNYGGRRCDYDHEMCVCTKTKHKVSSHMEQRDFL